MKPVHPGEEEIRAGEFNEIASVIFAPVYPVLAQIILKRSPANKGICLDLGSGPGHLAVAIARSSEFTAVSVDLSVYSQKYARENIRIAKLENRVLPVRGDVHRLPFHDNSVDLAVSRGSIFFWDSPVEVFNEVHRVLKPGCVSFIGGGFGTPELKKEIFSRMENKGDEFKTGSKKRMTPENIKRLSDALSSSAAGNCRVEQDEANLWFIIQKEMK